MQKREDFKQERKSGKKGQISIFVIIALVIVGIVLVVFLYPRLKQTAAPKEINPESYLESCIEPDVKNMIDTLARQGGYQNPEGYAFYDSRKVKYLCYTGRYYETCVIQQPLIKANFENELSKMLQNSASRCLASLESAYKGQGYSVSTGALTTATSIVPGKIKIEFAAPMKITKGETTKTFEKFEVEIDSEIYELIFVAHSIVDFEASYGDSETTVYLNYYPNLRVEKIVTNDGSKIYRVSNVITNEMFIFASRSLVWPPGYGL